MSWRRWLLIAFVVFWVALILALVVAEVVLAPSGDHYILPTIEPTPWATWDTG